MGGQTPEISVILVSEEHSYLAREALKEQDSKEDVVVLSPWAKLRHVCQWLHGEDELHLLELGELVACQEGFFQLIVGLH